VTEGLSLLAVDDERPALTDLVRMLRKSGAVRQVDMADTGSVALRLLNAEEHPYDGVFLDVRMPDLSGTDVAKVLARFATPPAVVFVTAYPDAAVARGGDRQDRRAQQGSGARGLRRWHPGLEGEGG